jgi:hypothetical protein
MGGGVVLVLLVFRFQVWEVAIWLSSLDLGYVV